jgi:hypothetical protein
MLYGIYNDGFLEIGGLHVIKNLAFSPPSGLEPAPLKSEALPECSLNCSYLTLPVNHLTHLHPTLCVFSHKFTAHGESCNANPALLFNNLSPPEVLLCLCMAAAKR